MIWRCIPFSQWQCSFQRKLNSLWLKSLRQPHVAVARQGPDNHLFDIPGVNRHFQMACIMEKLNAAVGRKIGAKHVWEHLLTMYDLQALVSGMILFDFFFAEPIFCFCLGFDESTKMISCWIDCKCDPIDCAFQRSIIYVYNMTMHIWELNLQNVMLPLMIHARNHCTAQTNCYTPRFNEVDRGVYWYHLVRLGFVQATGAH